MKRLISLMLALLFLVGAFAGCVNDNVPNDGTDDKSEDTESTEKDTAGMDTEADETTGQETTGDVTEEKNTEEENVEMGTEENIEKSHVLDGKKVIFIGNSHTYYGNTVIEKSNTVLTQSQREKDQGYFYQLCKQNGATVSVTNWTFGNHTFSDFFDGVCNSERACDGENHKNYLIDRTYDYVIMQQGSVAQTEEQFLADCEMVMRFFQEANPDVKFVLHVSRRIYEKSEQYSWLNALNTLEQKGVIIVHWGKLVDDIIRGRVDVPGATQSYNQNSFIISKSSSDGYHPNMLTGYITTLMIYCAITEETAEGQPYDFCGKTSLNSKFHFNTFISNYYKNGATTNFVKIFSSEEDMKGIQQLIDLYLREKNYTAIGN